MQGPYLIEYFERNLIEGNIAYQITLNPILNHTKENELEKTIKHDNSKVKSASQPSNNQSKNF